MSEWVLDIGSPVKPGLDIHWSARERGEICVHFVTSLRFTLSLLKKASQSSPFLLSSWFLKKIELLTSRILHLEAGDDFFDR
jgi:hypothetical protein